MLRSPKLWLPVGALWLITIAAGFAIAASYDSAAGSAGVAPERLPADSPFSHDPGRSRLIMFAHPKCPCTRASIEDLNRLLTKCGGRIEARVLFFRPSDAPASWAQTDLWRSAASIPGVSAQEDVNGAVARKFGAETSGYVLLYDPSGRLLFRGGLTGSRGHAGDNAGASMAISLLHGAKIKRARTPVFGCSLFGRTCLRSDPGT